MSDVCGYMCNRKTIHILRAMWFVLWMHNIVLVVISQKLLRVWQVDLYWEFCVWIGNIVCWVCAASLYIPTNNYGSHTWCVIVIITGEPRILCSIPHEFINEKQHNYSLYTRRVLRADVFAPFSIYFTSSFLSNHKIMVICWAYVYAQNMYYIFRWRNTCLIQIIKIKTTKQSMCIFFYKYKINEHTMGSRHYYIHTARHTNTHETHHFTMKIIDVLLEIHNKKIATEIEHNRAFEKCLNRMFNVYF